MTTRTKEIIKMHVELLDKFTSLDLADLCNITEQAIKAGGGFGWIGVPERAKLKNYWNDIILIKTNNLIVGRLNGVIAGALQLAFKSQNNEAQKYISEIQSHFVAPWARGYGLAKSMIDHATSVSKENNAKSIQLDIRATQEAAIKLFQGKGFIKWGENPSYAFIDGKFVKGFYYYKDL